MMLRLFICKKTFKGIDFRYLINKTHTRITAANKSIQSHLHYSFAFLIDLHFLKIILGRCLKKMVVLIFKMFFLEKNNPKKCRLRFFN